LRTARKWRAKIVMAHKRGNKNVLNYVTILDAEDSRAKRSTTWHKVIEYYDKAVETCNHPVNSHQKALSYERAAFFLARLGKFEEAQHYFDTSLLIYETEWGSPANLEWLKEKRDELLIEQMPTKNALVGSVRSKYSVVYMHHIHCFLEFKSKSKEVEIANKRKYHEYKLWLLVGIFALTIIII
jgi:tetratricopeptide (TPR) repeat protein